MNAQRSTSHERPEAALTPRHAQAPPRGPRRTWLDRSHRSWQTRCRVCKPKEDVMPDNHESKHKPRIVLVHGAFADATGWQHVIPPLEEQGYFVTAVQNPLISLADDIATTKRVLDAEAQKGSLIVVGHSYGGAVISGAAEGIPNVKALIFIAAFAPEAGEAVVKLIEQAAKAVR